MPRRLAARLKPPLSHDLDQTSEIIELHRGPFLSVQQFGAILGHSVP